MESTQQAPAAALLAELEQEAVATRRILEATPADQYAWKPNEKGRSMGELCAHIATIPAGISEILASDGFDFSQRPPEVPAPASREDLLAMFDHSLEQARGWLEGLGDGALATWTMTMGGEEIMSMPKVAAIRMMMLNHQYHHRGQLSAYLRAAGARVPSVYGPTADENPFAA